MTTLATLLADVADAHELFVNACSCGELFTGNLKEREIGFRAHCFTEQARAVAAWIAADEQVSLVSATLHAEWNHNVAGELPGCFFASQFGGACEPSEADLRDAHAVLAALARTARGAA